MNGVELGGRDVDQRFPFDSIDRAFARVQLATI